MLSKVIILVSILLISLVSQVIAVSTIPGEDSKLTAMKLDPSIVKQKHSDAKNKYLVAKNNYITLKNEFLTARSRWNLAKSIENKDLVVEKGKKFLTGSINKITKQLQHIRTRVETSEFIDNSEELIDELDLHITILKNSQETVLEVETQEELIAVSKTVKGEWKKTRLIVKRHAGFVLVSKAKAGISKARKISGKIEIKIQNLEDAGFDITEFNERLGLVKANLINAESSLKEAQEIYSEIYNSETADAEFIEGSSKIKKTQTILKKTYVEIKDIVLKLRTMSTPSELPENSVPRGVI